MIDRDDVGKDRDKFDAQSPTFLEMGVHPPA